MPPVFLESWPISCRLFFRYQIPQALHNDCNHRLGEDWLRTQIRNGKSPGAALGLGNEIGVGIWTTHHRSAGRSGVGIGATHHRTTGQEPLCQNGVLVVWHLVQDLFSPGADGCSPGSSALLPCYIAYVSRWSAGRRHRLLAMTVSLLQPSQHKSLGGAVAASGSQHTSEPKWQPNDSLTCMRAVSVPRWPRPRRAPRTPRHSRGGQRQREGRE